MSKPAFVKELEDLINRYSLENESDTPDYILAEYLCGCLRNFNIALSKRELWFKFKSKQDKKPLPAIRIQTPDGVIFPK